MRGNVAVTRCIVYHRAFVHVPASPGWRTRGSVTIVWGDYLFSSLYKIRSSHFASGSNICVLRCVHVLFLLVVRVYFELFYTLRSCVNFFCVCLCVRVCTCFFRVSRPVVSTCFVLIRFASSCGPRVSVGPLCVHASPLFFFLRNVVSVLSADSAQHLKSH